MVQLYKAANGEISSFPDDATPEEIDAATNSNAQSNANAKTPSLDKNFIAGMLHGAQSLFSPDPRLVPNYSYPPSSSNQNPFAQKLQQSPVQNFDAYNSLGVTDQPINTPAGAAQTAGELFSPIPGSTIKPSIPLVKGGYHIISDAIKHIDPEEVGQSIQGVFDASKKEAEDIFDNVGREAKIRGVDQIPIDDDLVEKVSSVMPDTEKAQSLIDKMKDGDYSGMRKMQSELWQRGTRASSSDLQSERDAGEKIMDLRDRINNSIFDHFNNTGNEDLADNLQNGMGKYKDLMETYFDKEVPGAIKKLVNKARKIPDNMMKVLSENSDPMRRILGSNPFASQNVENLLNKQNAIRLLKYLGLGTVGLGSIGGGIKVAKNMLTPPSENSLSGMD